MRDADIPDSFVKTYQAGSMPRLFFMVDEAVGKVNKKSILFFKSIF
jgi:hypothetical protein